MSEKAVNEYKCDDCGFVYRPGEHAGKDLDEQDDSFVCPGCLATTDHFQVLVPPTDDVTVPEPKEDQIEDELDPTAGRTMYVETGTPDVISLHRRYQRKRLDPQPFFQRYQVWSSQKNSRLIESILLDLPIPLIYLSQEPDGTSSVIDGQQRLMALFDFLDGKYRLTGVSSKIAGKLFSELPVRLQDKIENSKLSLVEVLKESDPEVKFLLFQRLNEGSTSLNDQELRNCVHRGEYNEWLKACAGDKDWRKILNLPGTEPHKRMVDVELVLRYMAFREQTYTQHPDKKTVQFLDKQMVLGAATTAKPREAARRDFKSAVDLSLTVFGKHACRRFVAGSELSKTGGWDSKINRALMDVQLWGFNRHKSGLVVKNADALREAAIALMSNPEFSDLISHTISEKRRVERRFLMWQFMIDAVLEGQAQGRRLFTLANKEAAFKKDPTCAICGQKIHSIDDAHMDHVLPYSKGGATTQANAALTHRYCNMAKGKKTAPPAPSASSF